MTSTYFASCPSWIDSWRLLVRDWQSFSMKHFDDRATRHQPRLATPPSPRATQALIEIPPPLRAVDLAGRGSPAWENDCKTEPLFTMTNLTELKSQLAKVDQLVYATWLQEREIARRRIAELAVEFQLSPTTVAKDIEAAQRSAAPPPSVLRPPKVDLPLRKPGAAQHVENKYRNAATGDTWTGRGPRPRWLREALDAGAVLEDFLADRPQEPRTSDPLRDFQDATSRARVSPKQ